MGNKFIIIGGVAGGSTAAARLRRLDESSEIILFERGEHISFANCGLPYYVGGTIAKKEDLLVQTVKGLSTRYRLDIRINSEVIAINPQSKTVEVHNLLNGDHYEESYDYLILSPGAYPYIPYIAGVEKNPKVFTLRTIPDAEAIVNYIQDNHVKSAVIVGGGFIGLEMAENLKSREMDVSLVEATNQVQPSLDYEMAALLHTHLRQKGVNLILEDSVTEIKDSKAILKSGQEIESGMFILAIGVHPENELALKAGLEMGVKGTIKVDEYFKTSDDSIYAIGDAIEVKNYITGVPTHIPLAGPANRQARMLADNICGKKRPYKGTLGTSVAKVFNLTAASTGLNEKTLQGQGIKYKVIHIHPNSHAGYYPGASPITFKMTFGDDGRIFGAQAIGINGVEKRIDVIAAAIIGGLSVYDLQEVELSYAPPYSSGKDPVNFLGYVAGNILDSLVDTVQYHEINEIVAAGNILVDVRQPAELESGQIKGSINIPLPELRTKLYQLPKDKPIYITCQIGLRGYLAARILTQNGYKAINLDGGYRTYSSVYSVVDQTKSSCELKVDDTGRAISSCLKK